MGPDNSLLWGAVVCTVGRFTDHGDLNLLHVNNTPPPFCCDKNVQTLPNVPGWGLGVAIAYLRTKSDQRGQSQAEEALTSSPVPAAEALLERASQPGSRGSQFAMPLWGPHRPPQTNKHSGSVRGNPK